MEGRPISVHPRVAVAVIPAAGLGTRFLPATRAQPKEMLAVIDKPAVQYAVEEAVAAGIQRVLIITNTGKQSIEDHFGPAAALEGHLDATGRTELAGEVRAISALAEVRFIRQDQPRGLGHAVSLARDQVGDESFAVILPDDIMSADALALRTMIDLHDRFGRSVVAVREVDPAEIGAYGAVVPETAADGSMLIRGMVEKPAPGTAPSNYAIVGRYVFTPAIFKMLDGAQPGRAGEIQLTDAMARLLAIEDVYGHVITEGHYDIGDKLGFLKATVELALARPDLGPAFRAYMHDLADREGLGRPRPGPSQRSP